MAIVVMLTVMFHLLLNWSGISILYDHTDVRIVSTMAPSIMTFNINFICKKAMRHNAECHVLFIGNLSDIMLSVIMLNGIKVNVILLSVVPPIP